MAAEREENRIGHEREVIVLCATPKFSKAKGVAHFVTTHLLRRSMRYCCCVQIDVNSSGTTLMSGSISKAFKKAGDEGW